MNNGFSVLMSLYYKEKPEYFCACMDSILNQTVTPDQIIIVKDGPLTAELEEALGSYVGKNATIYTIVPIEKNGGLGPALAKGITYSKYNIVARMDTDDIAVNNRFELQLKEFEVDENLDICGSNIVEFEGSIENIVAKRNVPLSHEEIVRYQKKRDAFNHMTVMYKKDAVLSAGNYQSVPLMEDTMLWVCMILNGAKCKNIETPLVYARVGHDMFERRGGWSYFLKYRDGRKKVYDTGFISKADYFSTIIIQLIVAVMPSKIRGMVFKKILHRDKN